MKALNSQPMCPLYATGNGTLTTLRVKTNHWTRAPGQQGRTCMSSFFALTQMYQGQLLHCETRTHSFFLRAPEQLLFFNKKLNKDLVASDSAVRLFIMRLMGQE